MKAGELVVVWILVTACACLAAGMEALGRWPMPAQDQVTTAESHVQQAVAAIGPKNAAAVLALSAAWVAIYILGSVVLLMLLVEAVRWVRQDSKRRRDDLAESQAQFREAA